MRKITEIIPLTVVYRQRKWHWYWETWYQPNIRPGFTLRGMTADHEGEDPDEWWAEANICAKSIRALDLVFDGYRGSQDKWQIYGKTENYPYMRSIGELDWLSLAKESSR